MKREDISKLFPDATDEQISALLDINSRDIGRAKGDTVKLQTELDTANDALAKAQETIKSLEESKGDTEKLQQQLDAYKAAEDKRIADEKAAQEHTELMERMDAALNGRNFIHERMRDLVAEDFAAALKDKAYRGKSDADVFEAITRDKGYFAQQTVPVPNMPKPGELPPKVDSREAFLKLSMSEQAKFKAENADRFYNLFPELNRK